jgi:hypothetical protein
MLTSTTVTAMPMNAFRTHASVDSLAPNLETWPCMWWSQNSPSSDVGRGEPSHGAGVDRGGPSPGADVAMWQGWASTSADVQAVSKVPVQMWQMRAQSRCRHALRRSHMIHDACPLLHATCGSGRSGAAQSRLIIATQLRGASGVDRGGPSPGADVARGEPSPV